MEFASYDDFLKLSKKDRYYHSSRWDLYSKAQELIAETQAESVLELGSYRLPLVVGSDTMDRNDKFQPTYAHDAGLAPWPIADERYDVFVALQVWEHLEGRQIAAFREVRRIAKSAILSFPYRWDCRKSNPSHHGITEETIAAWTEGCPAEKVIVIPSKNNHRRILYHFDFEKAANLRTSILKKEQTRNDFCDDAPATLRREPAECRHRTYVKNADGNEVFRCHFIENALATHGHETEFEVAEDACQVCVSESEPTPACLNTVVSALLYTKISQLQKAGQSTAEIDRLGIQAEKGLRMITHPDLDEELPDRKFGDCVHIGDESNHGERRCNHSNHECATAAICHLCQDHAASDSADSVRLITRLPLKQAGQPVKNWMVGVTTSPRREDTLDRTLDSIRRAGWSSPWLFFDSAVQVAERHAHLPVTYREARTGAWPNYYLSLTEMLMRDPNADAYMIVQDDVVLSHSENLRTYLEQILWPDDETGVVSLFCSSVYHREQEGWRALDEKWVWGALAFIFSNEAAWAFISDSQVIAHRKSRQFDGTRKIDVTVGEWLLRSQKKILYPVPSLAKHIGESSTLWEEATAKGKRQASEFIR